MTDKLCALCDQPTGEHDSFTDSKHRWRHMHWETCRAALRARLRRVEAEALDEAHKFNRRITDLCMQVGALRRERDEARGALRPFGGVAGLYLGYDDDQVLWDFDDGTGHHYVMAGDLRRAAAIVGKRDE